MAVASLLFVQGTGGLCDDHGPGVAIPPVQVERAEAVIPQWYVVLAVPAVHLQVSV